MAKEIKKRNRKQPDELAKLQRAHRKVTSRHVLVLEADVPEDNKRHLFHLANNIRLLSNELTGEMKKRVDQLTRRTVYRELKATYGKLSKKLSEIKDVESDVYKRVDGERKAVGKQLADMQAKFGVTFEELRHLAEEKCKKYNVSSIFALTCAEDIWFGVEKVLYGNGKTLHFKKQGELCSIRAKQPTRGVVVKLMNGKLCFAVDGVAPFGLIVKKNDIFAQSEVEKLVAFLSDKDAEKKFLDVYKQTNVPQNTFRICYCTLVCEYIRGKMRVWVHITIEGKPVQKVRADGTPRYNFGKGIVSSDIGTQSIAAASEKGLILDNLAERDNKSTKESERLERVIQRRMDRSKRAMNPERFNEDGTYKKGSHGKWKKSKNYLEDAAMLKNIRRKNAESRKYSINEMSNRIRALGDIAITEPSNAKALQKKAKPSKKIDPKTGKEKNVKRSRYGYSLLHRCPGLMRTTLKKKFEMTGGHFYVVDQMYRASQYDHKSNTYTKKKLSQRYHVFEDGTRIQRDLYSAFLMLCANEDLSSPNGEECVNKFDSFQTKHDLLVEDIKRSNRKICNSGIKVA